MMAVGIVMVKEILEKDPSSGTMGCGWLVALAMLLYVVFRGQWQGMKQNFQWPTAMAGHFAGLFSRRLLRLILWLGGYKLMDASVASVLNETNVVFIVLLAWLMLGERVDQRKLAGMGLTVVGVIIMYVVI